MSHPVYDASHDWTHVRRVLSLSLHLHSIESTHDCPPYSRTIIILAALLHDCADRKYYPTLSSRTNLAELLPLARFVQLYPENLAELILEYHGAAPELAHAVQEVINGMSYSSEIAKPERTRSTLEKHPELAIVQDADRLDALGAVGIARTFTYGGAVQGRMSANTRDDGSQVRDGFSAERRVGKGLESTIEHFTEKLERLEGMMKTGEGRRLAREGTERLRVFKRWWDEEATLGSGRGHQHGECEQSMGDGSRRVG